MLCILYSFGIAIGCLFYRKMLTIQNCHQCCLCTYVVFRCSFELPTGPHPLAAKLYDFIEIFLFNFDISFFLFQVGKVFLA
jgi:hypothetical protein